MQQPVQPVANLGGFMPTAGELLRQLGDLGVPRLALRTDDRQEELARSRQLAPDGVANIRKIMIRGAKGLVDGSDPARKLSGFGHVACPLATQLRGEKRIDRRRRRRSWPSESQFVRDP